MDLFKEDNIDRFKNFVKRLYESNKIDNNNFKHKSELKETCELYLAYLLDDGNFRINVATDDLGYVLVEIVSSELFEWGSIKDIFIPFIKTISKEYNVNSMVLFKRPVLWPNCKVRSVDIVDIVNNNIMNNLSMKSIVIFVK